MSVCWGHFRGSFGSLSEYYGAPWVYWDYLEGILGSLLGYSTVTSGISGNNSVVLWKLILSYSGVTFRVSEGRYEGALGVNREGIGQI